VYRLESQVQRQQHLLDGLVTDLQQHSRSGVVRQQMMQRLQQWRSHPQVRKFLYESVQVAACTSGRTAGCAGMTHPDDSSPEQAVQGMLV
jgi:hypothetical protein